VGVKIKESEMEMYMGAFLKETRRKETTWKKQVEVGRILLKGILKK